MKKMLTLLGFENAILDLFEGNRITFDCAIHEDELIEEPERRETIINNIER